MTDITLSYNNLIQPSINSIENAYN
jgi:hypothetical protein